MVITSVEAIPVELDVKPRSEPHGLAPYVSNHEEVWSRTRMLVRVDTDGDITGWGEMLVGMKSASVTCAVIEDVIAPQLVGQEITELRSIVESFYFPYAKIRPFLGAVETALWDALGKHLDASISTLFGGRTADTVEIAYCLGIMEPEESRKFVRRAYDAGFRTLKTKAGHDPQLDVDRLIAMHDEVDGEIEFRIDPNQGWSAEDAVRVGARLEDVGVYLQYLEQPCQLASPGTFKRLRQRLRTPVAVNEDSYFEGNLHAYLREDAVDVAVVDHVPAGGILAVKDQAATAKSAGVSVAYHSGFDLGIKTAAMLHTVTTTPAIDLAPDSVYYAWEDYLVTDPPIFEDGALHVPDGPGLGVNVDDSKIEEYRID